VFASPRAVSGPLTGLSAAANDGSHSEIGSLTRRLKAGEEAAFREFHARYFDRLHRFLLSVCLGDAHAAQDALQATWVRVARHARAFDEEEVFWGWLRAIARNAARDDGRQRRRYFGLLEKFAFTRDAIAQPQDERWRAILNESLLELPPAERELLEGKYLRGASVADLSAQTGLTEKAVESRLLRLRRALAARMLEKLRAP
jgi:RNA polymerase sigma factor (sigma-70 family)